MNRRLLTTAGRHLGRLFAGAALVIAAGLLAWLSTRYVYQVDWTRSGRHSLSPASQAVVEQLAAPLEITVYAREQETLRNAVRKFINRYERYGADIKLHFIDPDAVPDETRRLGISINGEMVVRYQGRTEHVRSGNEETFTNALQRLLRGSERWLAFLEGHGERSPVGQGNHDLDEFARQLLSRGFKFQPVNLSATRAIPDNTSVLVISSPLVPWPRWEVDYVIDYLRRGGNLLWLGEPDGHLGLDAITEYLGIRFREGTIVDATGRSFGIDDPTITVLTEQDYPEHPVVGQFSYSTVFPKATSVYTAGDTGWDVQPLLATGKQSWQEAGELKGRLFLDPESDTPGPLNLALALERDGGSGPADRRQRIIITGDGDFLSNTYLANSGNLELGLRMVNWLSHDDTFISIPAARAPDTSFELSPLASGIIGLGLLIVLPVGLLVTGFWIGWRRKRL